MAKRYWENFYKTFKEDEPSKFAKVAGAFMKLCGIKTLTELGAGNGRDTKHFKRFLKVKAYDYAYGDENVKQMSLKDVLANEKPCEAVYSRFFFHCLSKKEISAILEWTPKYLFAEFRTTGDEPTLYKDHKRKFVDVYWFLKELKKKGYGDVWYDHGKGFAKYKGEDPLVFRILTKKIK